MAQPSLSPAALARIQAVQQEAGADLLEGLDAFWRGIGMSTKALKEHDPFDLMPLFERYAEKLFDAEAKEWLTCFSDPDAYGQHLIMAPVTIAARICPNVGVIPDDILATDWKDLVRTLKARAAKSGRAGVLAELGSLSGDWENYLDHSFSRRFLKGRITTTQPDRDAAVRNFMALFWWKYLFHLRLFGNNQRFIQRLCTHMSVRLRVWRAEAYRRMADTLPPPASDPGLPQTLPGTQPRGSIATGSTPRKRGPKTDHETALRVAGIIAAAPDGVWKDKLDEICSALDRAEVPYPKTWPKRELPLKSWEDGAALEPTLAKKAIEHWLKVAKRRKKSPPETLS